MDPALPELTLLHRKYTALIALRRRKDQGQPAPSRAELRELARDFPGCLRELDTLGLAELERRAAALAAAAAGGAREPWMAWISAYHLLMRAALQVKRKVTRGAPLGDGELTALAVQVSAAARISVDLGFIRAVASPPEGRLGVIVLRQLGASFGVPAGEIAAVLFPLRRPSPYTL
jgi:hypothetical protein